MKNALVFVLASLALAGCNGGGGGASAPVVTPVATTPVAPIVTPPISATPGNLVTSVPAFTGTADHVAALTALNAARGNCGFGLLAQNAILERSAMNHGVYITNNFAAHPEALGHTESAALPGFTGVAPADRNLFAGYSDTSQTEDVDGAFTATPQTEDVTALLTLGYHLKSLVGQGAYDVGIAASVVPTFGVSVIELGSYNSTLQDLGSADLSTYPCAGTTVKTAVGGIGREAPDPFPARDYTARPLGAPIYARVRVGQTLTITSFTVTTSAGVAVASAGLLTVANDPNHILAENEVLFYPDAPLTAGTYIVAIMGSDNGSPFTRTFTFTTT